MFLDVQDDKQIACRAAVDARFALAGNPEPRTGFDARRDLYLERFFLFDAARAAAFLTGIANDLAFSAAVRAGAHYAEKALLVARLAAAAAGDAVSGGVPFSAPLPSHSLAFFEPRNAKLFFFTGSGLFERDLEIVAKIGAALDGCPPAAALAEHIAEPEEIENVLDIRESRDRTRRPRPAANARSGRKMRAFANRRGPNTLRPLP